ncbi:MAG: hypothetical protein LBT92_00910 [Rickettsiales bacterium]|jgi:hypothetical protein|nr:hypothetical protein [Rickettsiales bacterium]
MNSIELCSQALVKIGAAPIVSFDDGSLEASVASYAYPLAKRKLLSSFAWGFATKSARLSSLSGGAFAVPNDFLRAICVRPKCAYAITGHKLAADADAIELDYVADVGEELFPPLFESALMYSLAAEFAMSLLDDSARYNLMEHTALLELREARFQDSSQKSAKSIKGFPLVDARK